MTFASRGVEGSTVVQLLDLGQNRTVKVFVVGLRLEVVIQHIVRRLHRLRNRLSLHKSNPKRFQRKELLQTPDRLVLLSHLRRIERQIDQHQYVQIQICDLLDFKILITF